MSSEVSQSSEPASTSEADVATRVIPRVESGASVPAGVAWDDESTRHTANRRLLPTLVAAGVGALAALGTLAAALLGVIQRPWGLWVLVGLAGLAGGCIAGALAGWSIEAPMRRLLKRHPWETMSGQIGRGEQLVVIADNKRRAYELVPDRLESVGEVGSELTVRACGNRDEKVIEFGPRRRWRYSERVAVMLADDGDFDELDDDDWQPSGPVGPRAGADGLYDG